LTPDPRTRAGVRAILAALGRGADKRLGQHFLVEPAVFRRLVEAAGVGPGERVVEVGPGLGGLTESLVEAGARVMAIEKDARLGAYLEDRFAGRSVTFSFTDALRYDWGAVPEGSVFVANLPYNVGTRILMDALASGRFDRLVAMLQREVADRFTARPGSKDYGPLSLKAQYLAEVERLFDVAPGSFYPPPKVTSSILRLRPRGIAPDPGYFRFLDQAFAQRRKTLRKNLEAAGYERAAIENALKALGLDPRVRAEAVGPEAFRALYRLLNGSALPPEPPAEGPAPKAGGG